MLKQTIKSFRQRTVAVCVVASLGLLLCAAAPRTSAQGTPDYQEQRQRAMQLYDQNKFTDAIPLFEQLVKAHPDDLVAWERLGWSTLVVAGSIKDPEERKQARNRARAAFQRAKELGDNSELLNKGFENLSGPDPADLAFSSRKEADQAMREGEEAHTRGDLDKAIAAYQRALQLDPKLYLAALYIGDMYFKKGYQARADDTRAKNELLDKSGEWFARAIAIEENIETAHRYWGDALMLQGKQREAMLTFIDAIIAEPGNRNGYMGLSQWGERNQVSMSHPQIEIPVKLSPSGDKKLEVSFDPALRDSPDGSGAWEQYGLVRAKWVAEDFTKAFPNEQAYRHSLREETEALRKVAEVASGWVKSGKVKSLSPSLAALVKLNEAGLLESYIFFNRVDQGIVRDYEAYRQANRDKLRRYWAEFVISSGR
jgi:tetratricopeptide (TPR) repeat protein